MTTVEQVSDVEGLVEAIARAMFDEWPTRAISPALAEQSGKDVGAELTWEDVLAMGGNHDGLLRLARGAAKVVSRKHAEDAKRIGELEEHWRALDRILADTHKENDQPDRVMLEGEWHYGPAATAMNSVMRSLKKLCAVALKERP